MRGKFFAALYQNEAIILEDPKKKGAWKVISGAEQFITLCCELFKKTFREFQASAYL